MTEATLYLQAPSYLHQGCIAAQQHPGNHCTLQQPSQPSEVVGSPVRQLVKVLKMCCDMELVQQTCYCTTTDVSGVQS
jgi:hypothetical protein